MRTKTRAKYPQQQRAMLAKAARILHRHGLHYGLWRRVRGVYGYDWRAIRDLLWRAQEFYGDYSDGQAV